MLTELEVGLLQIFLWNGQSEAWQRREQYVVNLHLIHLFVVRLFGVNFLQLAQRVSVEAL
jgi:hypothetical protein